MKLSYLLTLVSCTVFAFCAEPDKTQETLASVEVREADTSSDDGLKKDDGFYVGSLNRYNQMQITQQLHARYTPPAAPSNNSFTVPLGGGIALPNQSFDENEFSPPKGSQGSSPKGRPKTPDTKPGSKKRMEFLHVTSSDDDESKTTQESK